MAGKPKILKGYLILKKSSLITHHLKYPNSLKVARLAHCFQLLITQFFVLSVRPIPKHHVSKFCLPTRLTLISFHFLHCSFLLQPFSFVTLPKPETNPAKIEEAWTPISTVTRAAWPISLTCTGDAISSIMSRPSGIDEVWRNVTHFLDLSWMISSNATRCYLIPFCTLLACFFIWFMFLAFGFWENC